MTAEEFVGAAAHAAAGVILAELGVNPLHDAALWEHAVARRLDGTVTEHNTAWDVEVGDIRVEVKFSRAFPMSFGDHRRLVFRWANLDGHGNTPKGAAVLVLLGLHDGQVYSWVLPQRAASRVPSATINVPRARAGASRSPLDGYAVPTAELLTAVLHHAETRALTLAASRDAAGQQPLPGLGLKLREPPEPPDAA